jgi:dynein intermediate chain 2, axonemal
MFEREMRKEKNLEAIKKQQDLAKKAIKPENTAAKEKWEKKKQELITDAESKFNSML